MQQGRVLAVTAVDSEGALRMAVRAAYRGLSSISFGGMIHRTDIAAKALPSVSGDGSLGAYGEDGSKKTAKTVRLGVLGSTRGTDLQAILDAIKAGELPGVSVAAVVSNRSKSGILERARTSGIVESVSAVSAKGCASRAEFDAKVTAELEKANCDLVLMIGYMRIVSDEWVFGWCCRFLVESGSLTSLSLSLCLSFSTPHPTPKVLRALAQQTPQRAPVASSPVGFDEARYSPSAQENATLTETSFTRAYVRRCSLPHSRTTALPEEWTPTCTPRFSRQEPRARDARSIT